MDPKKPLDISGISAIADMFSKGMAAKPGEKPTWWQTYSYPESPYFDVDGLIAFAKTALFFQSLSFNEKVYEFETQGDFIGTSEAILATLENNGARLVYNSLEKNNKKRNGLFFIVESGAIYVEIKNLKKPTLHYNCAMTNKDIFLKFKKIMNGFFNSDHKKNPLFMISMSSHDAEFVELGSFPIPLNTGNYSTDVVRDFQFVVKQFNSEKPSGRLLILNGLPGTGKTYIVRGLLNDLDSGTFLLLPPDMIDELSKPRLIEVISEASQNRFAKGPLYLIIEDADIALLRRGGDNMGILSTLLNLADGLLGSAFDLRIIATTNASKLDMEPAILRPGRLCKAINLEKLPADQANELLKKINVNSKKVFSLPTTLAEVYAAAAEGI